MFSQLGSEIVGMLYCVKIPEVKTSAVKISEVIKLEVKMSEVIVLEGGGGG